MYKGDKRPCIDCKEIKSFFEFYMRSKNNGRPKSICKKCDNIRWGNYRSKDENKSKLRKSGQNWSLKNSVRKAATSRSWYLKRDFGITLEEYNEMLRQQNEVCSICGRKERIKRFKNLAVDHDKVSGKIRGLLCNHCNTAIGKLDHSVELLQSAINYLTRTGRDRFMSYSIN